MNLQCGYIPGTQSMCYHPVQNVTFWGNNWTNCHIILNGKIIHTIKNNNKRFEVSLTSNNNNIELRVNDSIVHAQHQLYYVDLKFDSSPFYVLTKSMIVDH